MEKQVDTANYKVAFREKVAFGVGDLAVNFVWASIGMFIVYFYTDIIGIGAGIVGTLMLISRIWDGISDIIMGNLIDKTHTKYGKARPWILWLSVPFGISTVLLFAVPSGIGDIGTILYIFITYNIMVIAFTGVVIPYGTLNTLITRDINERSKLNLYRMFFANIGGLIVGYYTLPLVQVFGGTQSGWVATYTLYSVIGICLFLMTFKYTKERVGAVSKSTKEKVPLKISLKMLTKNKYWIIVCIFCIVNTIGGTSMMTSMVYFAKYIFGDPNLVGYLSMSYIIFTIIGIFFVGKLVEKVGKRNVAIIGSVIYSIGAIIILMGETNFIFVVLGTIFRGIGNSTICAVFWAFLPDTIEYGEYKTGVRNEGITYSAGSFGQKFGSGVAAALVGWILSYFNYDATTTMISNDTILAVEILFLYLPLATYILQIILMYFYKLDKFYPKMMKELIMRNEDISR